MNDKIQHILISAVISVIGAVAGYPVAGAAAAIGFFFGREHAAAVWNLRFNEGWMSRPRLECELEGLKMWKWRKDNLWDFLVTVPPAVVVAGYNLFA